MGRAAVGGGGDRGQFQPVGRVADGGVGDADMTPTKMCAPSMGAL